MTLITSRAGWQAILRSSKGTTPLHFSFEFHEKKGVEMKCRASATSESIHIPRRLISLPIGVPLPHARNTSVIEDFQRSLTTMATNLDLSPEESAEWQGWIQAQIAIPVELCPLHTIGRWEDRVKDLEVNPSALEDLKNRLGAKEVKIKVR